MKAFIIVLGILFHFLNSSFAQDSNSIKVYFFYGSKPARCCKLTESKYFGGIHGGHVSIGIDTSVIGFGPKNGFHVFARKKNFKSSFYNDGISSFLNDTAGCKYATFIIPLADSQYFKLKTIINKYVSETPYDYAFIGMRCAAASYDLLSRIGIFKIKSKCCNIASNFYPKLLRKKIFKLAKQYNYKVIKQPGHLSRKWEKD